MKLIIAGSRDLAIGPTKLNEYFAKFKIVPFEAVTEVVSGFAIGMDTSGEYWAEHHAIPVTRFPAEWKRFGKYAGPLRNQQMAMYADAAIVFINNKSRGSTNMIEHMVRLRKPFVHMEFESYLCEETEEYIVKPLSWYSWHDDIWEKFRDQASD